MSNNKKHSPTYVFSGKVIEARHRKGMNQEEAAEALGIARRSFQKYEEGDGFPQARLLFHMAYTMGISLDEIAREIEEGGDDPQAQ